MKRILFCFIIIFFNKNANAQTSVDSIKLVINNLFKGIKSANAELVKNCFLDSAVLQTIVKNNTGEITVKTEAISGFYNWVASEQSNNADERIVFDMIKEDGLLATAWLPYKFYYKNKFSHCGVNSIQLIYTPKGWKIQYLTDTRYKDCK